MSVPDRPRPRELADGKLTLDRPAPEVARLTISNPAKRNGLDHPILDALTAALGDLDARCVIVTGAHGMFSAGYDIGEIPDDEFEVRAEALVAHPFTAAIDALEAYPCQGVPANPWCPAASRQSAATPKASSRTHRRRHHKHKRKAAHRR